MLPTYHAGTPGRILLPLWVALCFAMLYTSVFAEAQPQGPLPSTVPEDAATSANAYGSIHGVVADAAGVVIAGASLRLLYANGVSNRETVSGEDGHFAFEQVAAGPFTLSVTLPGFQPASATGKLEPGQSDELPPFALKLATVHMEVDAVASPEVLAEEQLSVEEQQRVLGFIPNFFVSYTWRTPPLSARQKYSLAWKTVIDPGNLLLVGTVAGVQQAANSSKGYGQGAQGYGKRYGADAANLVVGTMVGQAVLPALFHQDPRYFYKGTGSIASRTLYALSSAVTCRGDDGRRQPGWSGVLGDLSAGAISNVYYPASDRGVALTFENGLLAIGGDALNGLFQEFVFRRLTPKAEKPVKQKH